MDFWEVLVWFMVLIVPCDKGKEAVNDSVRDIRAMHQNYQRRMLMQGPLPILPKISGYKAYFGGKIVLYFTLIDEFDSTIFPSN